MNAQTHTNVRVYYEDTDFSGRVYHASYLRFLERGRTEWLRSLGFEHRALSGAQGVVFAVRSLRVDYLAPGFMDDWLIVETHVDSAQRAVIRFEQKILREETALVEATVDIVTLKNDRATRPPRELFEHIGAVSRHPAAEFVRRTR